MDDNDDSSVKLLLNSDIRKTDNRSRKHQQNRAANALFFGVVLGFVFSFLFAYSGVINDNNNVNYSADEQNQTTADVPDDTNLADYLYGEVRVLCVVMTSDEALNDRGLIIMDTWGKRCNKLLFFSEKANAKFDNVIVTQSTDQFARLREAFKFVFLNHFEDFDWIMKTNDASFVVLENLRHMLYQYETEWPLVIGQRYLQQDYMIGVYILSKRAFSRLIENAFTNPDKCRVSGFDDQEISKCLEHINVIKVDGIDDTGRGRFFPDNPESALFPEKYNDYDKWYWNKLKQGIDHCCSDRLILIQNFYNTHLYYLEYFIYKVHAFGRHRNREPLPRKLSLEDVVKNNFR